MSFWAVPARNLVEPARTSGPAADLEPDGSRKPFTYQPTVEDSIDQRIMAIGSVDDVVDVIGAYRDELDLQHLVIFPDLPGLAREQMDEQLHLVAEEVMPRLGRSGPR
jgi:hypothetical protein